MVSYDLFSTMIKLGSPISTQRSTFSRNLRIIEGGKRVVRRSGSVGSRFSQMTHKECESETEKEESTPVPQMKSASTTPEALVKSPPKPKPRTVRVSKVNFCGLQKKYKLYRLRRNSLLRNFPQKTKRKSSLPRLLPK